MCGPALTKASRYELPCQSGIEIEREREGGESQPMPWFSTRPSIPAEISSLPPCLARGGLMGSASQVKRGRGEGGDGGSEGRGQAGEISHIILAEAGRSLVPPMRALPLPPCPQPRSQSTGLLLCETRTEIQFCRHSFLLGLSPTCLPTERRSDTQ